MEENQESFGLVENRDAIELAPTWEFNWWWLLLAVGVVVLISFAVIYFRRKKVAFDPQKAARLAFDKAKDALQNVAPKGGRESAVRVSLILREYLAESLDEPALFQTHEEFIGRHDALAKLPDGTKSATSDFFGELAAMKYGSTIREEEEPIDIKIRGMELLERMHAG